MPDETKLSRLHNTAAWQPGDEPGRRQFAELFTSAAPLRLQSGKTLAPVTMAYETWGELAPDGANAILILPPLTMDTHASGPAGPGHPAPGWWDKLIGPGRAIDTDRFYVVCPNNLGSCQGSTGPASRDDDGRPWGSRFPSIDIADQVVAEAALAARLGIGRWRLVVGMSVGGARALEWAMRYGPQVEQLFLVAVAAATRLEQAGLTCLELELIRNDPHFHGGDYYELPEGCGPAIGVAMSRSFGHVRYGTERYWDERFGGACTAEDHDRCYREFGGYLLAQGAKMPERFDTNSYLVLSETALRATVARGRSSVPDALAAIRCPVEVVGFDSDRAYPIYAQEDIVAGLPDARLTRIESPLGHYSFLFAPELLDAPLRAVLDATS